MRSLFALIAFALLPQSTAMACDGFVAEVSGNVPLSSSANLIADASQSFDDISTSSTIIRDVDLRHAHRGVYRLAASAESEHRATVRLYVDGANYKSSTTDTAQLVGEVAIRFDENGKQAAPIDLNVLTPWEADQPQATVHFAFRNVTLQPRSESFEVSLKSQEGDSTECFSSRIDIDNAVNGGPSKPTPTLRTVNDRE